MPPLPSYPPTSFAPADFDPIANPQVLAFLATSTDGVFVVDADWSLTYRSPNSSRPHHEAKPGKYVCLTVTGTGIPPHIRDHSLDPFFTTKEEGRGTGLGLAAALRIITKHHGFIETLSKPGKGSQFKVYLPAAIASESMPAEAEALALPIGHGELILVVEDEAAIREVTHKTLVTYGYAVLTASDGLRPSRFIRNIWPI